MGAYACHISRETMGAIASEKPGFNREEFEQWLETHDGGFFVRDEGYPFDCQYLAELVFHQIYIFEEFKETDLFHRIIRKDNYGQRKDA